MKLSAFDKSEWNLINACEESDLIILAIPTPEIKPTLEALAPYLKQDAIISDTAQSKQAIVKMAVDILPDHVHFVGGNPIVSLQPGPENSGAAAFDKALYCLTPSPRVLPEAVQLLEDFVYLIGATPFYLDPIEHDGLMAGVNTMPTLLSVALINSLSEPKSWHEMRKLAGGIFSQVASGAAGDPDSVAEASINTKATTLHWIDAVTANLQNLKDVIQADDAEALAEAIDKAVVTRLNWQKDFDEKKLSNLYEPPTSTKVDEQGMFQRLFGFNLGGLRRR
jgi:prephenate dehydrogenase